MPNPRDNVAYLVEDLSEFIAGAELTIEDQAILAPEANEDNIDPDAYDIAIYEDEQENE